MINISYVYFNVWIIVSHSCHTCNKFSVPNPQFLTQNATDTKKKIIIKHMQYSVCERPSEKQKYTLLTVDCKTDLSGMN